jgi:hypothetical protein
MTERAVAGGPGGPVVGVHWPSDVLVATCLGFFIPLTISVANDLSIREAGTRHQ